MGIQEIKLKFVIPVELLPYRAVKMLSRLYPLSAEQLGVGHAFKMFWGGLGRAFQGCLGDQGIQRR
jgi:hypothetical protein